MCFWLFLAHVGMLLLMLGGWGFSTKGPKEACCRKCRYPVEGLAGDVCPECGGDLCGDGVLRPGDRVRVRPPRAVAIACRTLIVLLPMTVWLNAEVNARWRVVTTAQAQAGSGSGLFESVTVTGRAVNTLPRRRTVAVLEGPGGRVVLRVRDLAVRVRYDGPEGRQVRTADAMIDADILAWMAAAGVDVADERALEEARAIAALVRHVVAGGRAFRDDEKAGVFVVLVNVRVMTINRAMWRWWVAALIILAGLGMWMVFMSDMMSWRRPRWRRASEGVA